MRSMPTPSLIRIALAAAFVCCAGPAMAQDSMAVRIPHIMVSLIHPDHGQSGDFIVHLSGENAMSGCPRVSDLPYKTEFLDDSLNIETEHYTIDFDNLPKHPEYECGGRTVYPSANILLNRDMLKKKGTHQIRFKTDPAEGGGVDYYNVVYGAHSIELEPEGMTLTAAARYIPSTIRSDVENPLKLWFYPKGTVILRASSAPKGADLHAAMDSLARAHSLEPLKTVIKNFTPPIDDPDSFYYVDTSKKQLVAKQDGIKDGIPIDTIRIPATVYGANGNETVFQPIHVFAHTPNAYE